MPHHTFRIHIKKRTAELHWQGQTPQVFQLATGTDRDRLIAKVLHKVIGLRLAPEESIALGKGEFKVLGETLFSLLFENTTLEDKTLKDYFETHFFNELYNATDQNRYRLLLDFARDADEFATLPWEYLFYQNMFLAAGPLRQIDFLKKLPFQAAWLTEEKRTIVFPLRLLVLMATDEPDQFAELDTYFNNLEQTGNAQVKILAGTEESAFEQAFRSNGDYPNFKPHIVHFIGAKHTTGIQMSAEKLATYLEENNHKPHLVLLHTPEGIRIKDLEQEHDEVIFRLLGRQIPFLITLQNPMPEDMTREFVKTVYNSLLQPLGSNIATAVTEGRFYLARRLRNIKEYEHQSFGSPMLLACVEEPFETSAAVRQPKEEKAAEKPREAKPSRATLPQQERTKQAQAATTGTTAIGSSDAAKAQSHIGQGAASNVIIESLGVITAPPPVFTLQQLLKIKMYFKNKLSDDLAIGCEELRKALQPNATEINAFLNLRGTLNTVIRKLQIDRTISDSEAELQFNEVRIGLIQLIDLLIEADFNPDVINNLNLD